MIDKQDFRWPSNPTRKQTMINLPEADKERLARRLYETWDQSNLPWDLRAPNDATREIFGEGVDAILTELHAMGYTLSKRVPHEGEVS